MTVRCRYFLAAAALWMALPLPAQEPARLQVEPNPSVTPLSELSVNQKLANDIAEHLRQSGRLHHYTIIVTCQEGTAELNGTVADMPQHNELLSLVRGVPGVEQIIDHVTRSGASSLTAVQATEPAPEPVPMPQRAPHPAGTDFVVEPQPISQAPMPGPYDLNPPKMPPYAWPTYAPYNNYSRVAYPELYPYQSWPFIGPCYPFPKVPLGWRAVKLEWQDGHWWYSRYATPHDWWRLRYW